MCKLLVQRLVQILVLWSVSSVVAFASSPARLSSPYNGEGNVPYSSNQGFSWSSVSGANAYRIVISNDPNFSNFYDTGSSDSRCTDSNCFTTGLNSTYFSGTSLKPSTKYYWKVRSDQSYWSNVNSFTTQLATSSVTVNLYPSSIRNQAQFQVYGWMGGYGWNNSGRTVSGLTDSTVSIKFKDVAGWTTPAEKSVTLNQGGNRSINVYYEERAVPINGQCGSADGRHFSSDVYNYGSYNQCDVGSSSNNSFPSAGGSVSWTCSGSNGGRNASCSASKEEETITGSIRVILEPSSIRNNAQFQVIGWMGGYGWNNSGRTVSGLTDDKVTIEFKDVNGWITPQKQSVSVRKNDTKTIYVTYTEKPQAINGKCGSANGHNFLASSTSYGQYTQCSSGNPSNTSFPIAGNSVSWSCSGSNGGQKSYCSASRKFDSTAVINSINITPKSAVAGSRFTVTANLSKNLKTGQKIFAQFGDTTNGWLSQNSEGGHRQLSGAGTSYSYTGKLTGVGSRKVRVGIFDSNDKLVGSYSGSKYFTVSPPQAEVTSINITPKSGVSGTKFTVTAQLSEALKSGQKVFAQFGDTTNGWLSQSSAGGHRQLSGSGKSYSYSGNLTGVGSRKVRVGIFDSNDKLVGSYSGSKYFTVSKKNTPTPNTGTFDKYEPVGLGFKYRQETVDVYPGIGGVNDNKSWDINYGSGYDDEGKTVYAVESGTVITSNGWGYKSYGQLLLKHNTNGEIWYSGYLHMKNITSKSYVNKGDKIGEISHVYGGSLSKLEKKGISLCWNPKSGKKTLCPHLHFVKYKENSQGKLYSIDDDPKTWKNFETSSPKVPVVSKSSPILTNTKNLPACHTSPQEKCVKIDNTVQLSFSVSDDNQDLKQLEVNWDGIGSVESAKGLSGGSDSVTVSHSFTSSDLNNCPNNSEYRYKGNCWKKDITVTATAYDGQGNASNMFQQTFTLYDLGIYNAIKADKSTQAELDKVNGEIADKEKEVTEKESALSSAEQSCSASKAIPSSSELKPYDPFRRNPDTGYLEYVRKDKTYINQCSDKNSSCTRVFTDLFSDFPANSYFNQEIKIPTGVDYRILTTYNYKNETEIGGHTNYPAKIVSDYYSDGRWKHYETRYVNNFEEKQSYQQKLVTKLKDELIAQGGNDSLSTCEEGDYSEFNLEELQKRVRNHSKFDETVDSYLANNGGNREDVKQAIAEGVAQATKEIAEGYVDDIANIDDTIGGLLSFFGKVVTDPIGAGQQTIQTAQHLSAVAQQLASEAGEISQGLARAVASWDTYDRANFTAYISTHVAHEFAPTSKLKLLKGSKIKAPEWLNKAVVLVRLNKTGVNIPKKDLDALSNSYREQIKDLLDSKESLLTDKSKELASNINGSSSSARKKEWLENFMRGNAFNKRRLAEKPNWKHELYLCKSPNGCDKNPKEYVRLDSYDDTVSPSRIISRKHTQLSEVTPKTAKGYINELATKYKEGMTVADVPSTRDGTSKNPTTKGTAGMEIQGQQVLEIPKQDNPIPKEIQEYADSLGILIVEAD